MTNLIFKINNTRTEDDIWELISFKKLNPETNNSNFVTSVNFDKEIKTRFLLGEYQYGNLIIELALMPLYNEKNDSVALCFNIGNDRINSHGVLYNDTETAIPTDRDGSAIHLSTVLPPDFYVWLKKLEKTMSWDC
jgi:hypothetical protein